MRIQSNTPGPKNLLDTAAANGSFETFGKAVESAGLGEILRGPGPFTVFAPTDAVFDKLPMGTLDNLFKPENKVQLASILNYHVLSGRRSANDVGTWQAAKTVNGQSAPVKLVDSKVVIDGANMTTANIATSNGVIHGIDKVNMPQTGVTKQ